MNYYEQLYTINYYEHCLSLGLLTENSRASHQGTFRASWLLDSLGGQFAPFEWIELGCILFIRRFPKIGVPQSSSIYRWISHSKPSSDKGVPPWRAGNPISIPSRDSPTALLFQSWCVQFSRSGAWGKSVWVSPKVAVFCVGHPGMITLKLHYDVSSSCFLSTICYNCI